MSKNVDRCRRLLGECAGHIGRYAGLAEAPKGRLRRNQTMSPGDLSDWRYQLLNRMRSQTEAAIDRIYSGGEGSYMDNPQESWKRTGKKAHDALKKIEELLGEIEKVAKTAS